MSLADEILALDDLAVEAVDVPQWQRILHVRGMSGSERDRFEASMFTGEGKQRRFTADNIRARLVAYTTVDERGKRIFTDDQVAALGAKNAAALNRLFAVAQRLSGISDGDVEELEKNSGNGQSDDSISDLPSRSAAPSLNS